MSSCGICGATKLSKRLLSITSIQRRTMHSTRQTRSFGHIEMPFTIDYFGGWDKAYPEVIEAIFRDQVQRK